MDIEENAYKHKSRIPWLQVGDGNNHFFFHAMKDRFARNSIDVLYDYHGNRLTKNEDI